MILYPRRPRVMPLFVLVTPVPMAMISTLVWMSGFGRSTRVGVDGRLTGFFSFDFFKTLAAPRGCVFGRR